MEKIRAIGVQKLVKRLYADTVLKDGKTVESKMKGKSYWICTSELGRFVAEDGSGVIDAIDRGKLFSITLNKTDQGLEYVTHTTTDQEVNFARSERIIADITNPNVKLEVHSNPEELV
jgi:hypothetical protein